MSLILENSINKIDYYLFLWQYNCPTMKKVVLFAIVLLTIVGCSKKSDQPATTAVAYKHVPSPYTIKEDFEMGSKAAYLLGDVTIKTGNWSFDDALLGKLPADIKNDLQSVRLRTGKMTMNFDLILRQVVSGHYICCIIHKVGRQVIDKGLCSKLFF